ncbi:MAG: peroxiredoxin, partial [Cyanobacteria bacterium J083]
KKRKIAKAYDVDGGGYAKRVTYVINGEGIITHVDAQVNTSTHAQDILSTLASN